MVLLLKNLLFTLLVPGTVAVYVPLLISGGRSVADAPSLPFGIALLALGGATYAWCVWEFATRGSGTPAPIDAPNKLVVRGLYTYIRNPMYVGVLSIALGWACVFANLVGFYYALAVAVCFHARVVLYEEPHLARTFGGEYEVYCSRTSRWLPTLRRGPAT